jgi:hypothetical protein
VDSERPQVDRRERLVDPQGNAVALDKINEVTYTRRFWDRVLWSTGHIGIESAATEGRTQLQPAADDDPFRHALD